MAKNNVRIVSDQNLITNAMIELLGADGEYHDVRQCVSEAVVTLKVGELSRVHLETIFTEVDVEALVLSDETLNAFAHQLDLHGWSVFRPSPPAQTFRERIRRWLRSNAEITDVTAFGSNSRRYMPGLGESPKR